MSTATMEDLTAENFKQALLALRPISDRHRALLRAHYRSPDHKTSAAKLAATLEYATFKAVYLNYGKLAERFCETMGQTPDVMLNILAADAAPESVRNADTVLTLRPQLVAALDELRWYSDPR